MSTNGKNLNFNETDNLSCVVISSGRRILEFSVSGIKSIIDVFRHVSHLLPEVKGLLTLNLRNVSQGWSDRYPLCLR